jgi:hypothetical protein
MPNLTRIKLTLSQDAEQVKLKTVGISYGYTLSVSSEEAAEAAEAAEADEPISYRISVDVLGDDLLTDDELALDVDSHSVVADEQEMQPIEMERAFVVGQALLDEDVGDDEIKLRIVVRDDTGELTSAMTDVIRGRF